jgi:7,8-dihydropterin-6-yl-methyl-4-(beta-D-ribofuranosyl)aminobenzene 5'-phosphate synthase
MRMLNVLLPMLFLLFLRAGIPFVTQPVQNHDMQNPTDVTLTVLCDNYNYDKAFKSSWGFSCLVEYPDRTILFDCGGKDGGLMDNFRAAGKDPGAVDLVVLSHINWDHTGGLPEFLATRTGIKVYVPASFPQEFKQEIRNLGSQPADVTGAMQITDNIWTTGEMGDQIIEQSLLVETPGGLVVLTGCAHPGIEAIVNKARQERGNRILLVMGGMHLLRTDARTVESIADKFREEGIQNVAPTHCSGDATLKIFEEKFGDRYVRAGAGRVIHTGELRSNIP